MQRLTSWFRSSKTENVPEPTKAAEQQPDSTVSHQESKLPNGDLMVAELMTKLQDNKFEEAEEVLGKLPPSITRKSIQKALEPIEGTPGIFAGILAQQEAGKSLMNKVIGKVWDVNKGERSKQLKAALEATKANREEQEVFKKTQGNENIRKQRDLLEKALSEKSYETCYALRQSFLWKSQYSENFKRGLATSMQELLITPDENGSTLIEKALDNKDRLKQLLSFDIRSFHKTGQEKEEIQADFNTRVAEARTYLQSKPEKLTELNRLIKEIETDRER